MQQVKEHYECIQAAIALYTGLEEKLQTTLCMENEDQYESVRNCVCSAPYSIISLTEDEQKRSIREGMTRDRKRNLYQTLEAD